jgi:hypothetical protein
MFGGYVKVRESLNARVMIWVFLNQVTETKAMLLNYYVWTRVLAWYTNLNDIENKNTIQIPILH